MKKDPVKEFAKKFWDALEVDGWGYIDPWIFRYIAEENESEWGESEKSIYKAIQSIIVKKKPAKKKKKAKKSKYDRFDYEPCGFCGSTAWTCDCSGPKA